MVVVTGIGRKLVEATEKMATMRVAVVVVANIITHTDIDVCSQNKDA